MAILISQIITTALAGQVGPVLQMRGGPGSAQLPQTMTFQLTFTYGSGGTTVSAWLQTSIDGELTWCDVAGLTAMTTASVRSVGSINSSTYALTAATDGSLAAGTVNNGLFGPKWRIKWTSTGTYAGNTTLRVDAHADGLVLAPSSGG